MIYEGITREQYDQLEGINWSKLKYFEHSIKHGHYMLTNDIKDSAAMREGRAIHTLTLEAHKFNSEYCTGGPINPSTNKCYGSDSQKFKDWLKDQGDNKTFLTKDEAEKVNKIAKAIKSHKIAGSILRESELKEFAVTWKDDETGIKCKSLLDFGSRQNFFLGDLKTLSFDLSYERLSKKLLDYYGQFAFYSAGAKANGLRIHDFKVIWAQTTDELDIAVSSIGEQTLHYGSMLYEKCLKNYRECMHGNLPGYHTGVIELDVPYWAMSDFLDIEESGIQFEEVI